MYHFAVFASGNGTTLQTIIDHIHSHDLKARISLVVSDNPKAYALERAKQAGISTYVIQSKSPEDRDIELTNILKNYPIDLIVLAGYLKLIGKKLIKKYTIINTHPSLLPKYGGKGMYGIHVHQAVINAKEKESGVTLHFVNEKYDRGDIIKQTKVEVLPTDTAEDLSARVQAAEKIQLIEVLKDFINGKSF